MLSRFFVTFEGLEGELQVRVGSPGFDVRGRWIRSFDGDGGLFARGCLAVP